jgi:methyl-accepting chemotaxis protein
MKVRFSHKVIIASSIIFFVSLSLLTVTIYAQTKVIMEKITDDNTTILSKAITQIIENEYKQRIQIVNFNDTLIEKKITKAHIRQVIKSHTNSKLFSISGAAFPDGTYFTSDKTNWNMPDNWDPRKEKWYTNVTGTNAVGITQFFSNELVNVSIMTLSTSIRDNLGELVSVVFYDTNLAQLGDKTNAFKLFETGYIFLVSETGITLTHPIESYITQPISQFLGQDIDLNESKIDKVLNNELIELRFTKVGDHPWYIGMYIPKREVVASATRLRDATFIFTIVFTLISIAGLWFLVIKLIYPLKILNRAMENATSGDGDLTQRLDTQIDQEFSVLAINFNVFASKLQTLIQETKGISIEIRQNTIANAEIIKKSAEELSYQETEVEELATSMNQMTSTALSVASNAKSASDSAYIANEHALEGQQIVADTVTQINHLSEKLNNATDVVKKLQSDVVNIESILEVINDIAEQTNLLALNAAIEAARAGETGRGFAVVADEVRTLAQRTQKSTDEISTMINDLQNASEKTAHAMQQSNNEANNTVDQSKEATFALSSILESVESINKLNTDIANSAEIQSEVANKINNKTSLILDLSKQVTNRSQLSAEKMKEQIQQVEKQSTILGYFKV